MINGGARTILSILWHFFMVEEEIGLVLEVLGKTKMC